MSVNVTLPTPVVQMGLVEKIVEVEQNHPLVQQQVAQETALRALEEQSQRIRESEESGKGRRVDDKSPDQRRREREQQQRRAAGDNRDGDEEDLQPPSRPWSGHLLNIKI